MYFKSRLISKMSTPFYGSSLSVPREPWPTSLSLSTCRWVPILETRNPNLESRLSILQSRVLRPRLRIIRAISKLRLSERHKMWPHPRVPLSYFCTAPRLRLVARIFLVAFLLALPFWHRRSATFHGCHFTWLHVPPRPRVYQCRADCPGCRLSAGKCEFITRARTRIPRCPFLRGGPSGWVGVLTHPSPPIRFPFVQIS